MPRSARAGGAARPEPKPARELRSRPAAAQLAGQTRARSGQIAGDLGEVSALLEELRARAAEGRFEELDMQLADSRARHPARRRVIGAGAN
jgi:hypothetical protein